jgi:hypothetical protein
MTTTKHRLIEGFEINGVGNGEVFCEGEAGRENHLIKRGRPIYWRQTSVESDEWASCCGPCARAYANQDFSDMTAADAAYDD